VLDLDAAALDPATKWRSAASMPTARNHFGTAVVGGKIYAIGGQHGRDETNRNLRDVHLYDPATDRWSSGPRLPKPMSHFHNSTVVQNGRILIAGGVTNGRFPLSDVFEYDPATSQWTAAAPMPAPRKAPLALIAAGRLYVLTGSPGDNFPQNDVWYRTVA
jgi:N-acetylneuraminic acid mutarotase